MNDATKQAALTLLRYIAVTVATSFATHGIISASYTEAVGSILVAVGIAAWGVWDKYVKVILLSQLGVWKATAETRLEALKKAKVADPSAAAIADKVPDPKVGAAEVKQVLSGTVPILLLLFLMMPAHAQVVAQSDAAVRNTQARPIGNLLHNIGQGAVQNALAKPFQDLADFLGSDFDEAIRLATSIPDLQDGNGQACWQSLKSAGEVFKQHPVPATLRLATDIQAMRLLAMTANRVCMNSSCTQVFADATNAIQAAAPVPIPIPSLNALCSKIPAIAIVKPQ